MYLPSDLNPDKKLSTFFNPKAKDLKLEDYQPGDKLLPYEVIDEFQGTELLGVEYEQLMPYVPLPYPAFTVIAGDFVTTEDGTGLVHMAKAFGADDFRNLEKNNVPGIFIKDENGKEVPIVDRQGRFVKEITDFAGMPVKNYNDEDDCRC